MALLIITLIAIGMPCPAFSEMSSTNYQIYADTMQSGGTLSESGVYALQDTVGESASDFTTSSIYEIRAGYQYMERGYVSLDLSATSLNLGVLSTSSISSAATTATVGTDSESGYALSITGVSGTMITAVSDGVVTAGSEEYGFSANGPESAISGDAAVAASTLIASSASAIDPSAIVLTFKASQSPSSAAGTYSQAVTLAAVANI